VHTTQRRPGKGCVAARQTNEPRHSLLGEDLVGTRACIRRALRARARGRTSHETGAHMSGRTSNRRKLFSSSPMNVVSHDEAAASIACFPFGGRICLHHSIHFNLFPNSIRSSPMFLDRTMFRWKRKPGWLGAFPFRKLSWVPRHCSSFSNPCHL
jgi:hypothetical protein